MYLFNCFIISFSKTLAKADISAIGRKSDILEGELVLSKGRIRVLFQSPGNTQSFIELLKMSVNNRIP